jgi:two-component system LytT family response regulator
MTTVPPAGGPPLRVLVVDDVALARQRLERLLRAYPDVVVAASCADADTAFAAIAAAMPDLLLLDIDLPGGDGFALLERLPATERPAVVFTTAHGEYAARAFRVQALDYLLKPVSAASLREALDRARAHRGAGRSPPAWLLLREREQTTVVPMAAIDWIEAAGNYACIRAGGATHVYRETLGRLEARLDPAQFQRIHRSRIVNLARIASLRPLVNGDHVVVLHDGSELNLSRTWRDALFARLRS